MYKLSIYVPALYRLIYISLLSHFFGNISRTNLYVLPYGAVTDAYIRKMHKYIQQPGALVDAYLNKDDDGKLDPAKKYRMSVVQIDGAQVLLKPRYNNGQNTPVWVPVNSNQIEMPNEHNEPNRQIWNI